MAMQNIQSYAHKVRKAFYQKILFYNIYTKYSRNCVFKRTSTMEIQSMFNIGGKKNPSVYGTKDGVKRICPFPSKFNSMTKH